MNSQTKKFDICVFGCVGIDHTYNFNLNSNGECVSSIGSKGANQAVAACNAGASVALISIIGKDAVGNQIRNQLSNFKIDLSGLCQRHIKSEQTNVFACEPYNNKYEVIHSSIRYFNKKMIRKNKHLILNSKILVCQCKVKRKVTKYLFRLCKKHGIKIVLTPNNPKEYCILKKKNQKLLKYVWLITANKKEALALSGERTIACSILKLKNMIVTAESDGVFYMNRHQIINEPALTPSKLVDTTGAGDTFNGFFITSLIKGKSLQESVQIGIKASTLQVSRLGSANQIPRLDELDD